MPGLVVGRTQQGHDLVVDLSDAWHIAVQGQTRSGKSVWTYLLLSQVAAMRNALVAGIDPTGILFAPLEGAPGADFRASRGRAEELEEYVHVLTRLVDLMDTRIDDLLAQGLDKMEEFTPENPLVIVVLEEYPGIIRALKAQDQTSGAKVADRLAPKVEALIGRLVSESAKVGIRVLAIAQRMSAQVMDTDTRSQMGTRISLRLDNADAIGMLHDNVDDDLKAQWPIFAPGVGVADIAGTRNQFRADLIDYQQYRKAWLERYPPTGYRRVHNTFQPVSQ